MAKEIKQDEDGWVHIPWSKRPSKMILKNGKLYLVTKDWTDDDIEFPPNISFSDEEE